MQLQKIQKAEMEGQAGKMRLLICKVLTTFRHVTETES